MTAVISLSFRVLTSVILLARSRMNGDEAPEEWRGGLNVTYRLGPGFQEAGWQTHLQVHTHNVRTTTYNVVATIRGSEEPGTRVGRDGAFGLWI